MNRCSPYCFRLVVWAGVLALCVQGCGAARYQLPGKVADSDLDGAIESLRFRIASEPGDGAAHAALARLEMRAGRPGAALRHFAAARERDALARADKDTLAALYAARLQARVAAGDVSAHEDARAAMALGARIATELRVEALFLAALDGYRRGQSWGNARASGYMAEAANLAPDDPRLACMEPQKAALPALGEAVMWLYRGGALRAAMELADLYVDRGGRQPEVLRAFVAVHSWWGRQDGSRAVGLSLGREFVAQGVSLCPLVSSPDAFGCAGTLWTLARGDSATAALVRARAHALGWRTADAGDAGAWALLAIRGWLDGEGDGDAVVRERVDTGTLARSGALSGHVAVAPTILRLAGHNEQAARALTAALARDLDAGQRALLLCEAAAQGRDASVLIELFDAFVRDHPDQAELHLILWRTLARHAREHGGDDRGDDMGALLSRAPSPEAARAFRIHSGDPRLWAEYAELWRVAAAYLDDPALGDRRAADYVDGAVYTGERAPLVAALFATLGAAERAQAWWERQAALHPRDPHIQFELGTAVARAGDATRAQVHFVAAAAASGDAGHTSLRAARVLMDSGHPLAAVAAARRALALTAPAYRDPILRLIIRAQTALGRHREARSIHARLRASQADPGHQPDDSSAASHAHASPRDPDPAGHVAPMRRLFVRLLFATRGPRGADRARAAGARLQDQLARMPANALPRLFTVKPAPPGRVSAVAPGGLPGDLAPRGGDPGPSGDRAARRVMSLTQTTTPQPNP